MNELEVCRKEIDEIDKEITRLFEKRMDVVLGVAKYKKENNLPIFHKGREEKVIQKNIDRLKNKDYEKELEKFFNGMMGVSRELQRRMLEESRAITEIKERVITKESKIGFQGVRGSFAEEALLKYFGEENYSKNYEEFEDVFIGIDKGEIDYGILPVENSSTGGISEVHDLLVKYDFHIVGEVSIKIEQCLMGLKEATIEDIDEVYSHSQGFAQSSKFLKKYDHLKLIPYHNTATSAKLVADLKDERKAAIGSKRASNLYGLSVIEEDINDSKDNHTRFIVIAKELLKEKDANKVSVVFSLEDKAGTLCNLLESFSEHNINMLRIESRPTKLGNWKYFLYVDFEGSLENKTVWRALEDIKGSSEYFKILGWYKKGV